MPRRPKYPKLDLPDLLAEIHTLHRQRSWFQISRIKLQNRVRSTVAGKLGYETDLPEKKRRALQAEADQMIKKILTGEENPAYACFVTGSIEPIKILLTQERQREPQIKAYVRQLPIVDWIDHPDQCGLGEVSLGQILGETGDISHYANVGKLWRRMGCAPFTWNGETHMGSTWKFSKKLPKEGWTQFGYPPKRRSIMYNVAICLRRGQKSKNGVYYQRIVWAKADFLARHLEAKKRQCDLHGLLLGGKMLLENLWKVWRDTLGIDYTYVPPVREAKPDDCDLSYASDAEAVEVEEDEVAAQTDDDAIFGIDDAAA